MVSWRPAALAGLDWDHGHGGPIAPGGHAHLCVFDPTEAWTVDRRATASRSQNSPYDGMRLSGRVRHTVLAGDPVVVDGRASVDAGERPRRGAVPPAGAAGARRRDDFRG